MMVYEFQHERLSKLDIVCLISVCLAFLWRALNAWYVGIDSAARIPMFFLFAMFLINFNKHRSCFRIAPIAVYSLLAGYMVCNGWLMGSASTYPKAGEWLIFIHIMGPLIAMIQVVSAARTNFNQTLRILTIGLMLFCLMAFLNSSINERGRLDSEINANEMALYGAITTGMVLMQYIRGTIRFPWVYVVLLPIFMTLQTGSRMGFAMIALIISSTFLLKGDIRKARTLFLAIIVLVVAFVIVNHILYNTVLGERLLGTTEQSDIEEYAKSGTILDYYGDRGVQYYNSWQYFIENPFFGIGFHKWMKYNPTGHVCHSELMVQYVECGLVAFVLWINFWYLICKDLKIARRLTSGICNKTTILFFVMLFSMFYADTVLWSYNQYCVFIVYALVISYPHILYYAK